MIEFRDQMADKYQIKLMTHTNQDGVRDGVTPSQLPLLNTPE